MFNTVKVKFENQVENHAQFDLLDLQQLFQRNDLNHNLETFHKIEFYMILIIKKGNGQHSIDFKEYSLSKGSVLTIRKDQLHKFKKQNELQGSLLLFTDDFLMDYIDQNEAQETFYLFNELLGNPTFQLTTRQFDEVSQNVDRIQTEYFDRFDEFSLRIIRSELHSLILKLFRLKKHENQIYLKRKYLTEFIQFQKLVEENSFQYHQVKKYAELMSISTKTLNSITKSVLHKTAKEFINETRVKHIKRLLNNTNLSVKEIAYESGFEDSSNLFKFFKKEVGTTPEQFRNHI